MAHQILLGKESDTMKSRVVISLVSLVVVLSFWKTPAVVLADPNCASYCSEATCNCEDRTHEMGCPTFWLGDGETICVSNYGSDSQIEVTIDQCSKCSGDAGTAYSFVKDTGTCTPPICNPCEEPNEICECLAGGGDNQIVVKVSGDAIKFKELFASVGFGVAGPCGQENICGATVTEANCWFRTKFDSFLPLRVGPMPKTVEVTCTPSNKHNISSEVSFSFTVQWYSRLFSDPNCVEYDFWHLYHTTSGTIKVKPNPRTDFDPFQFTPDARAGSGVAWMDRIHRIYVDPSATDPNNEPIYPTLYGEPNQPEWSWTFNTDVILDLTTYCSEDPQCFSWDAWLKPFDTAAAYYHREKIPAWQKDVGGAVLPSYMTEAGWHMYYDGRYFSLNVGSLGNFYFYCNKPSENEETPDKYLITLIEYCEPEEARENGTVLWRFIYENQTDRLLFVVQVNDDIPTFNPTYNWYYNYYENFTPEETDVYYQYDWSGDTVLDMGFYYQDTEYGILLSGYRRSPARVARRV
jgi:hypothetical protein